MHEVGGIRCPVPVYHRMGQHAFVLLPLSLAVPSPPFPDDPSTDVLPLMTTLPPPPLCSPPQEGKTLGTDVSPLKARLMGENRVKFATKWKETLATGYMRASDVIAGGREACVSQLGGGGGCHRQGGRKVLGEGGASGGGAT